MENAEWVGCTMLQIGQTRPHNLEEMIKIINRVNHRQLSCTYKSINQMSILCLMQP